MEKEKFKFRDKAEFEALSLEEKTRCFQELMRELKKKEEELERVNLEIAKQQGSRATPGSQET